MYFLTHNGNIAPTEEIAEAIQTGEDYTNPNGAVKNLVHRLRQKIEDPKSSESNSLVIQSQGCYGWNPNCNYWLDAEAFEHLCREAYSTASFDPKLACEKYNQALSMYRGEYLPGCPYTEWVYPARQYYRHLFVKSMTEALSLLKTMGDYRQMIELCESHLYRERFEEELHLLYLEALLQQGKVSQARSHYEYISDLFYKELGVKPTPEMKRFYRQIKERSENPGKQFLNLREVLQEAENAQGAFYCEVDYFRHLCKVERRRVGRENRPVHVGLLSFEAKDELAPSRELLATTMPEVGKVLENSLRKGDVFTRWSDYQYAVLLPGTTQEQADMVLARAKQKIEEKHLPAELTFKSYIYPVIPLESL